MDDLLEALFLATVLGFTVAAAFTLLAAAIVVVMELRPI